MPKVTLEDKVAAISNAVIEARNYLPLHSKRKFGDKLSDGSVLSFEETAALVNDSAVLVLIETLERVLEQLEEFDLE